MKRKRSMITILLTLLLVGLLALTALGAEKEMLTITGDGVAKEITFTRAQLEKMQDNTVQHCYSVVNNFPTSKQVYARGVLLSALLEQAGLKEEATIFTVTASDGYSRTFTRQELLGDARYAYDEKGTARAVPAIIALQNSGKSMAALADTDLVMMMGQREVREQNNPWFVKYVASIEVSTAAPEPWEKVVMKRAAGPEGVTVTLEHGSFDQVKLYYTTDGSAPGLSSMMYNPSASYFQPELNKPIVVTEDTQLKAVAIGAGKLTSAVSALTVSFGDPAFTDLTDHPWARTAIEALAAREIINGLGGTVFAPGEELTRAQFAAIMVRALGAASQAATGKVFTDVKAGAWYADYVETAAAKGWLNGFPDGSFGPEQSLSREQMLSILVRALGAPATDAQAPGLAGEKRISAWARPYVAGAECAGLLEHGHMVMEQADGTLAFNAQAAATRAEAAYCTYQMLERRSMDAVTGATPAAPGAAQAAAPPPVEGFSFIYMGDPQANPDDDSGYGGWGDLLTQAAAHRPAPEFLLIGGDLVNDESDREEWRDFFDAGGDVLSAMPLYTATGNHSSGTLYRELMELPDNGPAGYEELFYSFEHENAHFIVLDSNTLGSTDAATVKLIREWMAADLAASDRAWKIAVLHHPVYSFNDIPRDAVRAAAIQQHYLLLLEEYGVALILCGHQHVYTRTVPLSAGKPDADGLVQLMGVSGGKLYTLDKSPLLAASYSAAPVYTIITVGEDALALATWDAAGELVDSTVLEP